LVLPGLCGSLAIARWRGYDWQRRRGPILHDLQQKLIVTRNRAHKKRLHEVPPPKPANPEKGHRAAGHHGSPPTWLEMHGRDLRFLVIFGALMVLYYFTTTTSIVKDRFFPWYLDATTRVSAASLSFFGYDGIERTGNVISAGGGWITVERGCDAVAPTALFISAVIASPAGLSSKLLAVVGGTCILMVINVVRIVTLFLTRIHWREAFDVMHLDIWQAAFIFLAILLWALWASWTTQKRRRFAHA
jgi:exosortase/archaeosortase family protein